MSYDVMNFAKSTYSKLALGALEVIQAKLSMQIDLQARNSEEVDLVFKETCQAEANINRQLLRVEQKIEVRSLHDIDLPLS